VRKTLKFWGKCLITELAFEWQFSRLNRTLQRWYKMFCLPEVFEWCSKWWRQKRFIRWERSNVVANSGSLNASRSLGHSNGGCSKSNLRMWCGRFVTSIINTTRNSTNHCRIGLYWGYRNSRIALVVLSSLNKIYSNLTPQKNDLWFLFWN
jgi:hypothetical protein